MKAEFQRLQNVEFQYNQIAPQMKGLQTQVVVRANVISEIEEENRRLKDRESLLVTKIQELENALLNKVKKITIQI